MKKVGTELKGIKRDYTFVQARFVATTIKINYFNRGCEFISLGE